MTLWRLEWLRLIRTNRWLILLGVYLFFGVLGPFSAAYLEEIIERFGGGMEIVVPDPRPADGIAQFLGNASQLGLLAVVVVGTGALAIDARAEIAAFLRTRVREARTLLWPRYVTMVAAAGAALIAGTVVAWILTGMLIGPLPVDAMLIGTLHGVLYLALVLAALTAVLGFTRSQPAGVLVTIGLLLVMPALGLLPVLEPWMPSRLLTSVVALVEGAPAGDYLRAAVTTVVAVVALLALASWRLERREL